MEFGNVKMLMVKNPWGHFCYKGKFSINDKKNWTPELKAAFSYNSIAANDNGIFWIDIDTFCDNFENLYINWNPDLLSYRKSFYDLWKVADMSTKDFISIKSNP
jgi:calpain-7